MSRTGASSGGGTLKKGNVFKNIDEGREKKYEGYSNLKGIDD